MGGAGREGFVPAPCGMKLKDGAKDAGIGDDDDQEGAGLYKATQGEEEDLIDVCFGAGELQQWGNVTEEVVDGVGATERQGEHKARVDQ